MTKRTGRKTLLNVEPKLVERLCSQLRQGCSVKTACQASGISETSFHDYNRRADPKQSDYAPQFAQFAERVARARGEGKASLVEIISKAASRHGDWRAAMELLRSIAPNEYAPRRADGDEPEPRVVYVNPPTTTTSIVWDRPLNEVFTEAQREYLSALEQ